MLSEDEFNILLMPLRSFAWHKKTRSFSLHGFHGLFHNQVQDFIRVFCGSKNHGNIGDCLQVILFVCFFWLDYVVCKMSCGFGFSLVDVRVTAGSAMDFLAERFFVENLCFIGCVPFVSATMRFWAQIPFGLAS